MLKHGYTLMHEHTKIDLSRLKNDDCNFNDFEQIVIEYKELYDLGVRNIVDVTNIGMGRDVPYVLEVAKQTGINILFATGFYQEKFLPELVDASTVEELAKIMIDEIENGIENTNVCADIIGEIGTSKDAMTKNELKVFKAAVIAHKKTGKKLSTHCTLGTFALEQIKFFVEEGVDLKKVVIGHLDLTGDINYIIEVLKTGVYIEFDTIGKNNYMSDKVRVECLKEIERLGYTDKVFLSLDITRKTNLKNFGGIGYSYLFETFIPMCIKNGVSEEFIKKMLNDNPNEFLNS